MKLKFYQIDAFANQAFEGNPAGVVPLDAWLSDTLMQSIAEENNLAETAFFVSTATGFHIRWFTPKSEIALCGHATLASAFVLFNHLDYKKDVIEFDSQSGILSVSRQDDLLTLNFPAQAPQTCATPELLSRGLGCEPVETLKGKNYIAVFGSEADVASIAPDFRLLEQLDGFGVAVTAPSDHYDFVARFFAPKVGIPEDPVTGSAYTGLAPYWSRRLRKRTLSAKQLSARGGEVFCEDAGERILISGKAVRYLEGTIEVPDSK